MPGICGSQILQPQLPDLVIKALRLPGEAQLSFKREFMRTAPIEHNTHSPLYYLVQQMLQVLVPA